MKLRSYSIETFALLMCALYLFASTANAADKPNIVVIWGDDTGMTNVSAYGQGVVGYKTPNIDRIANKASYSMRN
jgi:arylsulfatase